MADWEIDIREPQEMIDLFKAHTSCEVTKLDIGDYVYKGRVAFERKNAKGDFVVIQDVMAKVGELRFMYPFCYLIVEGNMAQTIELIKERFKKPSFITSFTGMVSSLTVRGCPPIFAEDKATLFNIMVGIAEKTLDGKDRSPYLRPFKTFHRNDNTPLRVMIATGIGEERSRALLRKFGTVENIIISSPEELMKVPGIGPGTVDRIDKACAYVFKEVEDNADVVGD